MKGDETGNSYSKEFWIFCRHVVDRLKNEPFLLCTFSISVLFVIAIGIASDPFKMTLISVVLIVVLFLLGRRYEAREKHLQRMALIEIETERSRGRAKTEEKRLKRIGQTATPTKTSQGSTKSLPSPGNSEGGIAVTGMPNTRLERKKK